LEKFWLNWVWHNENNIYIIFYITALYFLGSVVWLSRQYSSPLLPPLIIFKWFIYIIWWCFIIALVQDILFIKLYISSTGTYILIVYLVTFALHVFIVSLFMCICHLISVDQNCLGFFLQSVPFFSAVSNGNHIKIIDHYYK
jgi:hypothetical protein